jgi:hypothetical protein
MNDQSLQAHLLGLEQEMIRIGKRRDSARMAELLHEEFREFGRSGREYSRQKILQQLSGETTLPDIGVADAPAV